MTIHPDYIVKYYDELVEYTESEYEDFVKRVLEYELPPGVRARFTMTPKEIPEVPEGSVLDAFLKLGTNPQDP